MASRISEALLLFLTSPSPTALSMDIAMEHITAATTVFGRTDESSVAMMNQTRICCLTEVPTRASERAAMRWSTPVASHAMLMISEPARRKTSSAE